MSSGTFYQCFFCWFFVIMTIWDSVLETHWNSVIFLALAHTYVDVEIAVFVISLWEFLISCPVWMSSAERIIWVRFNLEETLGYKHCWQSLGSPKRTHKHNLDTLSSSPCGFVHPKNLQHTWEQIILFMMEIQKQSHRTPAVAQRWQLQRLGSPASFVVTPDTVPALSCI